MGDGLERMAAAEVAAVRRQARRVHARALLAAVAYAVVTQLLP